MDLLVDFDGTSPTPPVAPITTTTTTSTKVDLLDLFNEIDNIDTPTLTSLPTTNANAGLIENNNSSLPIVINQNSNFIGSDLLGNIKTTNGN